MNNDRRVALVRKRDGTTALMAVSKRGERDEAFLTRVVQIFANCGGMGTLEIALWSELEKTEPDVLPGMRKRQKEGVA